MQKLSHVLQKSNIRNVLGYLMADVPNGINDAKLSRYYTFSCNVLELWSAEQKDTIVITNYKKGYFEGMYRLDDREKIVEEIDWKKIRNEELEVFVPDSILDLVDIDMLMAECFFQWEKQFFDEIPERRNEILFREVIEKKASQIGGMRAVERVLERQFSYEIDQRAVKNEVREYYETKNLIVKWGDVWEEDDEFLFEHSVKNLAVRLVLENRIRDGEASRVYKFFKEQDLENPGDVYRCYTRKKKMKLAYEGLGLANYQRVEETHKKIIIEQNLHCERFPLVYVRDQYGETQQLSEVDESDLVCMDIWVKDENISDPLHALAIVLFYLEYPLRVARIQEEKKELWEIRLEMSDCFIDEIE